MAMSYDNKLKKRKNWIYDCSASVTQTGTHFSGRLEQNFLRSTLLTSVTLLYSAIEFTLFAIADLFDRAETREGGGT